MNDMLKRLLSFTLALVMVFGMMPAEALASELGNDEPTATPTEAPTEVVTEAPATEHTHAHEGAVTTAATCEAEGVMTYTCSCGDTYTEAIAALGHTYVDGFCACGAEDPDWTPADGGTEGDVPEETTEAPAHTHAHEGVVTTGATCTEDGVKTFTCSCGDSYTEAIAATGHAYEDGVCGVCGAADPDYEEKPELSGETRKIYYYNVESWDEVWAAWSFDEDGFDDVAHPGEELSSNTALENVYVIKVPVEADEVLFSDGIEVTEELLEQERLAGVSVTHEIEVRLAEDRYYDLYQNGAWANYAQTVKALEETEPETEAPAEHTCSYVDTVTKEATCEEAGEMIYACTCGKSNTEVMPALGHDYAEGKCTRCGAADPVAEVQAMIDALPTSFATQAEVDNFWDVTAAELDAAIEALTAEQQEQLDTARYDETIDAAAAFVNPEFDNDTTWEMISNTDPAWRSGAYIIEVYNNASSVSNYQLYNLLDTHWDTETLAIGKTGWGGFKYGDTQIKTSLATGDASLSTGTVYQVQNCDIQRSGFSVSEKWSNAGTFTVEVYDILTINTIIDGATTTNQVKVFRGNSHNVVVEAKNGYDVAVSGKATGTAAGTYTVSGLTADGEVNIEYTRKQYTVTWNAGEGAFANGDKTKTTQVTYGNVINEITDEPVLEGYSFVGWDGLEDGETMPAENVSFTAQYDAKPVKRITVQNKGDNVAIFNVYYEDGEAVAVDGMTVKHLDKDGEVLASCAVTDDLTNNEKFVSWVVSEDGLTYTADWTPDTNNNDVVDSAETVQITLTQSANVSVEVTAASGAVLTDNGNGAYTLLFKENDDATKKVTVKATPDKGYYIDATANVVGALSDSWKNTDVDTSWLGTDNRNIYTGTLTVESGKSYTVDVTSTLFQWALPMDDVTVSLNGYLFNGITSVPKDAILAAIYGEEFNPETDSQKYTGNVDEGWGSVTIKLEEPFKYKITLNATEKYPAASDTIMVTASENRVEAAVENKYVNDSKFDTEEQFIDDVKSKVVVTANGETLDNNVLIYESSVDKAENGTYTLTVEVKDSYYSKEHTETFENLTWTVNQYTVTWVVKDENGNVVQTVGSETVPYGTDVAAEKIPAVPAKTGYTGAWSAEAKNITTDTQIEAEYTVNTYTVNWTINGEAYDTTDVVYGTAVTAPEYTVPKGHTFGGWDVPTTMPAKNITLDAELTVNSYDVVWVWQNAEGQQTTTQTLPYGAAIVVPAEIPSQYTVGNVTYTRTGWTGLTDGATVPVNGITYTATYTEATAWIVDFDSNGGSEIVDVTVIVPEGETKTVSKPATDPTREGYRFDGWYLTGENGDLTDKYDFATPVTADITLTAKWVEQVTVTFDVDGDAYKDQVIDINTKATNPADPDKEYAIFGGWFNGETEFNFDEAVTENVDLTAKWIDDVNNNNVLDENETVTITVITEEAGVGGEVTVSGATEIGDGKYVYDSLNGATVSVAAKPVIEDGSSKSYVSEIKVNAEPIALKYNEDYSVTYEFTVEGSEIATAADLPKTVEITFTDCGFIYDEDGQMRFYVGMEDPDYETLYNAVITSPEYVEGAVTAKYLARPAATYQMQVPVLFQYTIPLINYEIKIGGDTVDIDLDDAWLDVGESFKTLTPEELQKQYDTEIQKIKDKIAAIDLTDITWSNAGDKVQQFAAIREELNDLIETMKNEATYLGYHQFGASSLVDENGNAQEILQIVYKNDAMCLLDEEVYVTLVDDRIATTITGGNLTFEYDEFTDETIMDALVLTDANGNVVEGELTKVVDLAGTEVGSRTYSVSYAGSWDYKPATAEFTLTVIKAPSNTNVENQTVTYGSNYSAAPVITNKHGESISVDTIEFFVGLDVADLDVDGDGVKGLEGRMQLILTDELQTILSMVGLTEGVELNISDLISALTNTGLLEQWGVTGEMVEVLKNVLDSINSVVETNNLMITIGGDYPTDIGVYLQGAVTVDKNYETSFDMGYLVIKPQTTEYTLEWNEPALTNAVVTLPVFNAMDKGAHAVEAEDYEASYLILGINDETGNIYTTDIYGNIKLNIWSDPNEIKDNGAYVQIAYGIDWGNEFAYAMPIIRSFAVVPALYDVQLVGATGEPNDELLKTFNNEQQGFSVIVKDNKGDVIYSDHYQNVVELRENAQLVVNYVGVQTNGQPYNSNEKPVHAGVYAATAVYMEFNDGQMLDISNLDVEDLYELFDLADIGADMGLLVIEPAESTIDVEDKIVAWDGTHYVFADQVTATSPAGVNPDKTIISAGINTDGDFSENGWAAVGGTVNVDFPRWMDELLAEQVPGVKDGITAAELKEKLTAKLPGILSKLEDLGATNEIINSLNNLVDNLNKVLAQIPDNMTLTFKDDVVVSSVGAYAVAAIVTDSDHIPAADAGVLVILPEVDVVDLKWNHEDANNIWTRELLEQYDLWATAYDKESGELDAGATAVIHYQFIGMDKNGSLLVIDTNDANDLPNGVYTELAYIELEIDGHMYISDMIARTVIIVPNAAEVKFVDVNGNNARRFVFDNTQKTMDVTVALNGEVITPAEGTLTFTYNGIQTNGKTYNSTTAPVHAGVYTVMAEYADYTEGGSLAHYGAAAGIIAIEPAASTMDVTGGTVTYDGEGHTAAVVATGSGVTEPDYTLISGGAYVSGDINEVGVDAFHGNVNIDFPAWLDKALAEHEFKTEGVDSAYLTDFISSYRDDALALIPVEALVKLGVAEEEINAYIAKLNGYIDELLAVLEKLPAGVALTFNDDVTYTEPGYYFFYGIVTDSDHYPSTDTGLLVIEKKEILFDLLDTKVTWNGKGQMVDLNNPENADFVTVVIDRKNNTINIVLDEDAQYALNAVAKLLGVEFDGDVQMSTILDKYNGKEVAAAIVEMINEAQKLELPEEIRKVLDAVKAELETLPTSGTITVNGELPTELGVYEVYAISYSQHFKTTAAEAELEIVPVRVEVILNEVSKVYGEEDPELTYTVKYYDHEGNEMTGVDANITVQISREAGEDVGTYAITGTVTLGDNTHFELIKQPDASEFTITKATDNTWITEPSIEGWTYGETAKTPVGEAKYGEIKVEYRPADDPDAPFTTTVPTDAGDYIVRFTVEGTDNYNGITVEKELTIAKAASKITEEPKAVENLVYDGENHALITAGIAEGGKLVYSLSENGPFSEEIPVGKEAGTYTVYYKVAGDNNHNDSEVKSITVKIKEDHTGEYPIDMSAFANQYTIEPGATVDIDGTPVVLDEDCIAWVKNTDAKIVTTYKYHEGNTVNETYPTNMYVWYLTMVDKDNDQKMDAYNAERIPELDNLFEYNGTSIRVGAAKNGIRFFTSMNPSTRTKLQSGTLINTSVLKGAKMVRAGTVFKKNPEVQVTLENGVSSDVYGGKAGSNFRVFGTYSGRNWFTGMLVGLDTDAETVTAGIAARPYAQLQIGDETVVIYGGQIQRSIYYVACQNQDTFAQGSSYDQFVEGLIAKGNSIRGEG